MKDLSISVLLDFYAGFLTEKQAEIVDLYYNQDLSLTEISENLSITRQGVRDGLRRSEELLKSFEEKVGAVRKHVSLTSIVDKIKIHTKNIAQIAKKSGNYQIVSEAERIAGYLEEAQNGI